MTAVTVGAERPPGRATIVACGSAILVETSSAPNVEAAWPQLLAGVEPAHGRAPAPRRGGGWPGRPTSSRLSRQPTPHPHHPGRVAEKSARPAHELSQKRHESAPTSRCASSAQTAGRPSAGAQTPGRRSLLTPESPLPAGSPLPARPPRAPATSACRPAAGALANRRNRQGRARGTSSRAGAR